MWWKKFWSCIPISCQWFFFDRFLKFSKAPQYWIIQKKTCKIKVDKKCLFKINFKIVSSYKAHPRDLLRKYPNTYILRNTTSFLNWISTYKITVVLQVIKSNEYFFLIAVPQKNCSIMGKIWLLYKQCQTETNAVVPPWLPQKPEFLHTARKCHV